MLLFSWGVKQFGEYIKAEVLGESLVLADLVVDGEIAVKKV
jgi:hypothetical protein